MLTLNQKAPSEEEMEARAAEARKATAEGEFIILSEGKKKLKADSETLKLEIETDNAVLEEGKKQILKIKTNILDIENSFSKESDILNRLKEEIKVEEDKISELKIANEKERASHHTGLAIDLNSFVSAKKQIQKEIAELSDDKKEMINKISVESVKLESLLKESSLEEEKVISLKLNQDSLKSEISDSRAEILKLNGEIKDISIEKEKNELELEALVRSVKIKTAEDKVLDQGISEKKEEYNKIESQAFSILKRQEMVNQRELFIRSQFERAGVNWEE